jgi:hypothetical protein
MGRIRKAAAVAVMVGGIGFMGAGTAFAGGPDIGIKQGNKCSSHDTSLNVLSNLSLLNGGIASGLLGNEGDIGETNQNIGSQGSCSNEVEFD